MRAAGIRDPEHKGKTRGEEAIVSEQLPPDCRQAPEVPAGPRATEACPALRLGGFGFLPPRSSLPLFLSLALSAASLPAQEETASKKPAGWLFLSAQLLLRSGGSPTQPPAVQSSPLFSQPACLLACLPACLPSFLAVSEQLRLREKRQIVIKGRETPEG